MDLPLAVNQTASTAASAAISPSTSRLLIPPILIQPRPIMVRLVMDQLDIKPISIVAIITVRPIADQLDIKPINTACDYYGALHWINKQVGFIWVEDPRFKTCYKQNNIILLLFKPLLYYL